VPTPRSAPAARSGFPATLRQAIVDALRRSAAHDLPDGPLRRYLERGLAPGTPGHGEFLRATGVSQLTALYAHLAEGLAPPRWSTVAGDLARIAAYQAFEIISDNLAIGLAADADARGDGGEGTAGLRRGLLRAFNAAVVARLRGGPPAAALLAGEREAARQVSLLTQSLAGATHRRLAGSLAGALDADLWAGLVANAETAAAVADRLAGDPLGPLVADGLEQRYRAVTRTLDAAHLCLVELAAVGAHSVLVTPTLAYCVGVLAGPGTVARLRPVLADGTLAEALYDAALLSRLLNDAGTRLLTMSAGRRRAALPAPRGPLAELLTDPLFTRLHKDLRHGEFNVCLYAARRCADPETALDSLAASLDYYARLYAAHRARLATALDRLTRRLQDPVPATLVHRFVRFHAALYTHRYDDAAGEYAI